MATPRRTRLSVVAAALSGTLVVAMAGTALATEDLDCTDFPVQEAAQAVLDADPSDPHRLDGGSGGAADGVACGSLPRGAGTWDDGPGDDSGAPATTPAAAADGDHTDGEGDQGCPDFATQAGAQAALVASGGDEVRLDADGDGIACESYFGTTGRQVAVFPQGGVATGEAAGP